MTTRLEAKVCLLIAAALTGAASNAADELIAPPMRPVLVGEPVVPTSTPAVRDLPDWKPDPSLFGLEAKRREDFSFIPIDYPITPKLDPLYEPSQSMATPNPGPNAFSTLVHNYAGQISTTSPPDTSGDVGPTYFLQSANQSVSTIRVINKADGSNVKTFTLQSLATSSPCNLGFCDAIVNYDRTADRWMISELPSSGAGVCVYVSKTGDPTGAWWNYYFATESSTDYPKYGVWPQNGNGGSYLIGMNAGSGGKDLVALDRAKMLAGQAATFQKFTVANLPNSGFQLVVPSDMQGPTPPPNGEPAIFVRPHDDEAQNGASTSFDLLDIWTLSVDWATPANSVLTQQTGLHIADYDMTLCGLGTTWNCMPQPGTTQKIDPIREPLHYPFQYRNFGDHQSLVGTFVADTDGTDHAGMRWFELRKTGAGAWTVFQEGLIGGEAGVHRSVASIAMDGSGNIAIGYTRTGTTAPNYPSIYYKGRLSTDPLGTMPQGEYPIVDAAFSKTGNERWGDYAGIGIDPSDDCTFWFTTEYMTSSSQCSTKVAAFKFDQCGCLAVPAAPTASASVPQGNRIDVTWNDSATTSITQYFIYRATTAGGPYAQIATVNDSSPGAGNGPSYTYHDDTVSGGTRYYYVVKSGDGVSCVSPASNEVNALATGACMLAPAFAGVATVTNPGNATCTLSVSWSAGSSSCSAGLTYNVYRSTTSGFAPSIANRIASGIAGTSYSDAVGIAGGTTYYYVVRAVDTANGAEESNVVQKSGVPSGPITTTSFTDTFEGAQSGGGFDRAGWTKATLSGSGTWAWSTARFFDGTHSWFAASVGSANDKVLVSPAFGVGSTTTLSFRHTYAFESTTNCYDAGTLEYTTNGGGSWTTVPLADFTAGGYNGTAISTSSNPIGGKPAWCGGALGAMTLVSINLGGDANVVNKTVQIRWHEGDDVNTLVTGWYVDTVTVNNAQTGGTCAVGTGCTAPGAPTLNSAAGDCAGINLAWSAGTGATSSYNVYRATTAGGAYTKLGGMPTVSTSYVDTTAVAGTTYYYVVTGACDVAGATESVYSGELNASKKVNGASCSDGNACTQTDTCQSGACAGANPVVCTASDQCHDAGTCNSGTGVCSNPAKPDGASCSDANSCTVGDACVSGVCASGNPVVCTASDQCHDAGTCNSGTGVCSNPAKPNGALCSDANSCTVGDACVSGVCASGNPVVCTASDQCHDAGTCNSGTGVCSNPAKPDGASCSDANSCTVGDACVSGVCASGNPVVCTASDQCHDAGTCNSGTGVCSNPAKPDGASCSDANSCTVGDACVSGVCASGNPITCTASDQCHDAGTCDTGTGFCSNPAKADGASCSDANSCTLGDACVAGVCTSGNPMTCTASDQCHDAGTCSQETGQCSNPAKVDGALCDDANGCTTGDSCQSGSCTSGAPVVCAASDQCHDAGACDPGTGVCSNPAKADGASCSDANSCTVGDACVSGVCTSGNQVTCTASDQCHDAGTCSQETGQCSNPAKADGAACDDANGCTTGDSCQSGSCASGAPVVCTASDQCHDAGTCDPGTGACSDPAKGDGANCNDGNDCTAADTCQSGACKPGTPIPAPGPTTSLTFVDQSNLTWTAPSGAASYDVVRGTLSTLLLSGFTAAVDTCVGSRVTSASISDPHLPAQGDADWFLVRSVNACGVGVYDDAVPSQAVARDAAIQASAAACP